VNSTGVDIVLVFVLGALVGAGELVSRFRDEPTRAIASVPGLLYLTVNGLASASALVALLTLGWDPAPKSAEQTRLLQILAAGFGAMAVFRTALFTVRVSGTDIGVGPVAFLQIMLAAIDRAVDRKRARERAERVLAIMDALTFTDLFASLPAFAFALMQNLSPDDKTAISDQVKTLATSPMPEEAKVLNLGLLLMNYVGEAVLEEAVRALRKQLGLPDPPGLRRVSLPRRGSGAAQPSPPGTSVSSGASSAGSTAPPAGSAPPPATIDQAVVEAHPPSQETSPPPGTTAHGTALEDASERLRNESGTG
jgi:hypothetical protein